MGRFDPAGARTTVSAIPIGLETLTLFVVVISFDQQGKPYEPRLANSTCSRWKYRPMAVSGEQSMGTVQRVKEAGKSECRSVMERIGIEPSGDIILRESVLTSHAGATGRGRLTRCLPTGKLDNVYH